MSLAQYFTDDSGFTTVRAMRAALSHAAPIGHTLHFNSAHFVPQSRDGSNPNLHPSGGRLLQTRSFPRTSLQSLPFRRISAPALSQAHLSQYVTPIHLRQRVLSRLMVRLLCRLRRSDAGSRGCCLYPTFVLSGLSLGGSTYSRGNYELHYFRHCARGPCSLAENPYSGV